MHGAHETAILVVAPDAPDQLLTSILSTSQLANTPLGPCRITWAHSFEEGMSHLTSRPFEACLVDSGLGPGCIGFLREARTRGWRRPLIFCTSVGQHDMQAAAQAAGATDVLSKTSVSLSTLGRVIQAAIQRSRFEETLRFGEEMVRILVEGTRDYGIYMLDREGRILTWNQGAERMTGYTNLDVIGHHVSMLYTREEREDLKPAASLRHAVSHGRYEEEGKRVRKDGTPFWAHVVVTPLYGEDGQLRGFSKVSRDISGQKEVQESSQKQGVRSMEAFRSSPAAMSVTSLAEGTFLDANEAFCRLFGYKRDQLVGRRACDFPGMLAGPEVHLPLVELLRKEGSYRDVEMVVHDSKGEPRRVRVSASRVDMDGQTCAVSTVEDVTAARFFHEQLARREARLREAERIAQMASWEWDIAGRQVHWSANMYSLLGLDPAHATARLGTYLDLVVPEDRPAVEAAMMAVRDAPVPFEQEHRIRRPDGQVRWMKARGAVSPGATGSARMVGTVQDITAEKESAALPPDFRADSTVERSEALARTEAPADPRETQVVPLAARTVWESGPKLILVKGFMEGSIFPLKASARRSWLIGRGEQADVALSYDPYVSRRGAEVRLQGDAYFIEDLAPTKNGTYVNGHRLGPSEAASLQDGDIVSIGRSLLVFRSK